VNDNFGRVPVFGYPLVCYSPRGESAKQKDDHSKWQYISRSIISKQCKQVLVKELLDGREIMLDKEEAV